MRKYAIAVSSIIGIQLLCAATVGLAANSAEDTGQKATLQKDWTNPGDAVHDVSLVGLGVTNQGLLGSGANSAAPSIRYPMPAGLDHLYAAGVWIGAWLGAVPKVSTGQYKSEIGADPTDYRDYVYQSRESIAGGRRIPGFADDDHDGTANEDPLNGRDDDGDGSIDEDYAAIGDQYFYAEMVDDWSGWEMPGTNPSPMHLWIEQESFAWSRQEVDDLVGVRYRIRNRGPDLLKNFSLGVLADFDVNETATNDLYGHDSQTVFSTLISDSVAVQVSYMYDYGSIGPYVGVVLLNHLAGDGTAFSGQRGLQAYVANLLFPEGDPVRDFQRMSLLEEESFDELPLPLSAGMADDYRIVLTAGPFGDLAPGQELSFEFAFVAGMDHDALLRNAANAVALARGQLIDGVQVPWSLPRPTAVSDAPRPFGFELSIAPNPFNPRTEISLVTGAPGVTRVEIFDLRGRRVRLLSDEPLEAGVKRWVWDGQDDAGHVLASGTYFVRARSQSETMVKRAVLVR